jgi:hypothetical protein
MCGRVIQSGGPLRYAIVDGMNVRDEQATARISDVHNSVAALAAKPPIRIILGDRQLGDRQWRAAR